MYKIQYCWNNRSCPYWL